jgi:hypothetical protein
MTLIHIKFLPVKKRFDAATTIKGISGGFFGEIGIEEQEPIWSI